MFWVMCAILAGPSIANGREGFIALLIWTAVVFVSILWHEMGHGWAFRKFGVARPEIFLSGMGGLCRGQGSFTRRQSVEISAAGPVFSLILAGFLYGLQFVPLPPSPVLSSFIKIGIIVNLGWAMLNLFPVLPLDGGRIFEAVMPDRRRGLVPAVGLIVASLAAVFGIISGRLFLGVLFGLLAIENWNRIRHRVRRGF